MTDQLRTLGFRLTAQQHKVAYHLAEGKNLAEIARIMGRSRNTIKTHAQHACKRLGIPSRNSSLALYELKRQNQALIEGLHRLEETVGRNGVRDSLDLIEQLLGEVELEPTQRLWPR